METKNYYLNVVNSGLLLEASSEISFTKKCDTFCLHLNIEHVENNKNPCQSAWNSFIFTFLKIQGHVTKSGSMFYKTQ